MDACYTLKEERDAIKLAKAQSEVKVPIFEVKRTHHRDLDQNGK